MNHDKGNIEAKKLYDKRYKRIQKKLLVGAGALMCLLVLDIFTSCSVSKPSDISFKQSWRPAFLMPGRLPGTQVDAQFSAMDIEQKIGQSMIIHLRWVGKGELGFRLDEAQRSELRAIQPGGVVLYAQNLGTMAQTLALIRDIRTQCQIPPFIAIDEEGGRVSRLKTSAGIKATRIPPAGELARAGGSAVADAYWVIGRELAALGFNMDFAPVADLGFPESNSIIGDRAFGTDPQIVARLVGLAIKGLQGSGVVAVIKHFPGHGRSNGDSHFGRQIIKAEWSSLYASDLIPFQHAIKQGVGGMMTAHIEYPLIDSSGLPVSLSSIILKNRLRKDLGYKGLIITDALDMQGVLSAGSSDDVALKSLNAGVDMLLSPENPLRLKHYLLQAIENRSLNPLILDQASRRILKVKNDYGILGKKAAAFPLIMVGSVVGSAKHRQTLEKYLE